MVFVDIPSPVAIIGAGFLGSALAFALPSPTHVTTRSGQWHHGPPPAGVRLHALDITAPSVDIGALADARSLVICVATGGDQDRRALYVEGTRRLLLATDAIPWRRIVYVSSTSAVPDIDGWVDETTPGPASTPRGEVQREAEDVVERHCQASNIPWMVLRLGGLYGPGREVGRLYQRRRPGPMPGDGHVPTNLIHRDDAVAAVVHALRAPAATTGVVHVVDDDHTTRREMYARAARPGDAPITWSTPPTPGATPRGKRVSNLRLKTALRVRLLHPTHA